MKNTVTYKQLLISMLFMTSVVIAGYYGLVLPTTDAVCGDDTEALSTLLDKNECSPILVTVAERIITIADFSVYMLRRSGGYSEQFTTLKQKQELLDELIQRELQVVHALEAGYDHDPEIVAMLERLMVSKFREQHLDERLKAIYISDVEIESYYQAHLEQYTTPAISHGAIIYFKLSQGASDEKRAAVMAKIQQALSQARSIPDSVQGFGALAVKYSDDQSTRYIGGDIGWVSQNKMRIAHDALVIEALFSLKEKAELAPIVNTDDGMYLVKLVNSKPKKTRPLSTLSKKIKMQLLHQKQDQVKADWLVSLHSSDIKIDINTSILQSIASPVGVNTRRDKPPVLPK